MNNSKRFTLFALLLSAIAIGADLLLGVDPGLVYGSLLGVLVTGAGVQTTLAGQSQCQQYLLIGDVDTAMPLRGLTIEIDGNTFLNIQNSQPLMAAFAKWQMEVAGAVVGILLKVATGQIKGNTTYTFTNDGVTTPNIYAYSDAPAGIPLMAATMSINANSFQDFSKFSALFIANPADLDYAEVVFNNGHKASMDAVELDSYFAFTNQSEANGRLAAVTVIDNTNQGVKTVRLYAGANPVVVLIAKLPNAAFDQLKA